MLCCAARNLSVLERARFSLPSDRRPCASHPRLFSAAVEPLEDFTWVGRRNRPVLSTDYPSASWEPWVTCPFMERCACWLDSGDLVLLSSIIPCFDLHLWYLRHAMRCVFWRLMSCPSARSTSTAIHLVKHSIEGDLHQHLLHPGKRPRDIGVTHLPIPPPPPPLLNSTPKLLGEFRVWNNTEHASV